MLHVRFFYVKQYLRVSSSNVSNTVSVCYDFPVSTPNNVLYFKENLRDGDSIEQEHVLGNKNKNENVKCTTEKNT